MITPRTLNSLRLTFNRSFRQFFPENYRTDVGRLWGVNWLNLPPRDFGFPQINVSGFSPVGDLTQLPIARHTDTYQLTESLSTPHGLTPSRSAARSAISSSPARWTISRPVPWVHALQPDFFDGQVAFERSHSVERISIGVLETHARRV